MKDAPVQIKVSPQHQGNVRYSFRQVSGFVNVPYNLITNKLKGDETGPMVENPYPRRLESLTICGCNYKGSTFSSVIIKNLSVGLAFGFEPPPPTRKLYAQLLEPLICGSVVFRCRRSCRHGTHFLLSHCFDL